MTLLRRRIAAVGDNHGAAMGAYHPSGTGATPMVMPLARVIVTQAGVAYDTVQPIYSADRNAGVIPATARGSWGQLYAAGRP